jgi:hypothetical protein
VSEPPEVIEAVARAIRKARLKFQHASPIMLACADDAPVEDIDIEHARAAIAAYIKARSEQPGVPQ